MSVAAKFLGIMIGAFLVFLAARIFRGKGRPHLADWQQAVRDNHPLATNIFDKFLGGSIAIFGAVIAIGSAFSTVP